MAAIECLGCNVYVNGIDQPIRNAGPWTDVSSFVMYGTGVGMFSGVSGVPLATVHVMNYTSKDGYCQAYTGQFNAPTGTGVSGTWSGSVATGCRSHPSLSGCSVLTAIGIVPNQSIYSQFPNSVSFGLVYDYCNAYSSSVFISGSSTPPPALTTGSSGSYLFLPPIANMSCGQDCFYWVGVRWLAPVGQSGYLLAASGITVRCTPCSPYEIVSLP